MATEFVKCEKHQGTWHTFCGKCAEESVVPAPPTRTEEPRKLEDVELKKLAEGLSRRWGLKHGA